MNPKPHHLFANDVRSIRETEIIYVNLPNTRNIKTVFVAVMVICLAGCGLSRKSLQETDAQTYRIVPTNMSAQARSVLIDLTGCFLATQLLLPPKATEALPSQTYETVQILSDVIDTSSYTVFLDHTNHQFWVLKMAGAPAVGEFYGPCRIEEAVTHLNIQ